jgi:hypothetical protein
MTKIVRNDQVVIERRYRARLEKRETQVPTSRISGKLSPRFA